MIKETLAQARSQAEDQIERLKAERGGLRGRLRDDHAELGRLAATSHPGDPRLADAHDRIRDAERRVTEIDDELATLDGDLVDEGGSRRRPGRLRRRVGLPGPARTGPRDRTAGRTRRLRRRRREHLDHLPPERHQDDSPANWPNERRRRHDHHRTKGPFPARPANAEGTAGGRGDAGSAPAGRVPRVSRLMALAIRFDQLIRDGVVADQAELARLGHVSRARLTQIMNLLNLAPDIQEQLLHLPRVQQGRDPVTERELRPICAGRLEQSTSDVARRAIIVTLTDNGPLGPNTASQHASVGQTACSCTQSQLASVGPSAALLACL